MILFTIFIYFFQAQFVPNEVPLLQDPQAPLVLREVLQAPDLEIPTCVIRVGVNVTNQLPGIGTLDKAAVEMFRALTNQLQEVKPTDVMNTDTNPEVRTVTASAPLRQHLLRKGELSVQRSQLQRKLNLLK